MIRTVGPVGGAPVPARQIIIATMATALRIRCES